MFTRKYRQRRIEDMIGSTNVRLSLTRLLEKGKLPNTLVLSGDNGIGKTSMAYALAYQIMCGCGEPDCPICTPIAEQLWGNKSGTMTDVYEFDLGKDRDERFVDNVLDVFRIAGKKVIILDEIQNLSQMNMTKFLKTFENVSEDTYLIICTTELYKLNAGIVSRCDVFELKPPTTIELATYLEAICRMEEVNFTREGVYVLANLKYRVRDAVNTLETIIDIYGKVHIEDVREYFGKEDSDLVLKFLEYCKESSPYAIMELLKDVKEKVGIYKFTQSLKETLVDCVYVRYGVTPLFLNSEQIELLKTVVGKFTTEELTEIMARMERFQGKSNLDKEVLLINLAFAISNGSLLKKVGVEEEKNVTRRLETPELNEDVILGSLEVDNGPPSDFRLDSPAELGNSPTNAPTPPDLVIDNESGVLDALESIFQTGSGD